MTRDPDLRSLLGDEGAPPVLGGEARDRVLDAMQRAAGVEPPPRSPEPERPEGNTVPRPAPRRRRWPALAAVAVVAAAIALAATRGARRPPAAPAASLHPVAGGVLVQHDGDLRSTDGRRALEVGDRVSTLSDGRATARIGGVATTTLAPMSELAIAPEGCELRMGTAGFEVDPLPAGRRFVVRTPDVDVEVHGTAFRVTVSPGSPTRVVVSDGVVLVTPRAEGKAPARLLAGDRWPPVEAEPTAAAAPPEPPVASAAEPAAARAPRAPDVKDDPRHAESRLTEQNRLLLEAAEAKRRGDGAAERKALDEYLHRFPGAPGAHDAMARKMRAAGRSGDTASAQAAARAYLAAFPSGPLADEARSVLTPR